MAGLPVGSTAVLPFVRTPTERNCAPCGQIELHPWGHPATTPPLSFSPTCDYGVGSPVKFSVIRYCFCMCVCVLLIKGRLFFLGGSRERLRLGSLKISTENNCFVGHNWGETVTKGFFKKLVEAFNFSFRFSKKKLFQWLQWTPTRIRLGCVTWTITRSYQWKNTYYERWKNWSLWYQNWAINQLSTNINKITIHLYTTYFRICNY